MDTVFHFAPTNASVTEVTSDIGKLENQIPDHTSLNDNGSNEKYTNIEDGLKKGDLTMSVVIPLLNEVESIPELYQRLKTSLSINAPNHEIIFVDDGSRDGSFTVLKSLWQRDTSISIIRFRRNQGKATALAEAFNRVRGDIIVMMDADLQDQPEELPKLIQRMDEGYDLVTGWKRKRYDPIGKTLPSKVFNGTISRYFKIKIHDFNCGFKIMKAPVAKNILLYGDRHRFIPVLAAESGYRVTECAIEHAPRVHGYSKYGAKRLITGFLDFLTTALTTKFVNKPLQYFGSMGLLTAVTGIIMGIILFAMSLFRISLPFSLHTASAVLVIAGVQLISTGLLAELIIHQSRHSSANPIEEILQPCDEVIVDKHKVSV